MSFKKITSLFAALTASALLSGALTACGGTAKGASDPPSAPDTENTLSLEEKDMFSNRDKEVGYDESTAVSIQLADDKIYCADNLVKTDSEAGGSTITLTQAGTYRISGSLSNGQIIVDADKNSKLQLVLDGVDITCASSAPLYVRTADKVFVTLADGKANKLAATSDFAAIDDSNIDAAVFSRSDLTLNGSGSLTVSCASGHGIISKDDLVITGGSYTVTAAKHALSGKDSVRIADGTLHLTAGKDGIHSENSDNMDKGFIYVSGGDIHINCESDGLDGDNTVQIEGGSLEIAAGNDGLHSDSDLIITDGTISVTKSSEGIEGKTITISGGNIRVVSSDDGLNASGAGKASGTDADSSSTAKPDIPGNFPDRGDFRKPEMNPDGQMEPPADMGDMNFPQPGEPPVDMDNFPGQGGFGGGFDEATDYNKIIISGGTLYVDAGGDGIDSNGDLTVTGGDIYIYGPTNNGNGALDYAGNGTITGGTVVAVGASGMAMNFGANSTQGSMLVTTGDHLVTGKMTLTDAEGKEIVSCDPSKGYNSVVISTPELATGQTYTLTAGDTSTTVNMESLIYSNTTPMFPPA